MIDLVGSAVLIVVCILLFVGLCQQFRVLSGKALLLNDLAIVPQWKFFGQSGIGNDVSVFDDLHLLVRVGKPDGEPEPWSEIALWTLWSPWKTLWNPHLKSEGAIAEHALTLLVSERHADNKAQPTALCYLAVLRHCFDHIKLDPQQALQFAITTSRGREERLVNVDVLSAWHHP